MSSDLRFPTMWYVRPAKTQTSLINLSLCKSLEYSMTVKLLTKHHFEFLSFKGGCTGSSESTLVKMPHCWKSHGTAHTVNSEIFVRILFSGIALKDISATFKFSN